MTATTPILDNKKSTVIEVGQGSFQLLAMDMEEHERMRQFFDNLHI